MILSIVIPMYGVEKYIEKCLMSCINQDAELGRDYEIICVNDGSKDKSAEIAKQIATHYNGVSVYDQENGGLSVARNNGLIRAQGDYVWFVDSDDWIEENCISSIIETLSSSPDMLNVQCNLVYEDSNILQKRDIYRLQSSHKGVEILKFGSYPTMAQLTIYKRVFLKNNGLLFYPGILHEDTEFTPRALFYATQVQIFQGFVYNYLIRSSGSITSSYKIKNALDALKVCDSLFNFSKTFNVNIKNIFAKRISQIILTHLCRLKYLENKEWNIINNEMSNKKYLFKYMCKSKHVKYKILGFVLLVSPRFTCMLFRNV